MRTFIDKLMVSDLPQVAALGALFYAEGKLPGRFNETYWQRSWTELLQNGAGVIFGLCADDDIIGALGGVLFPDPNTGEPVATEFFWYVRPEARGAGLKLLPEFERWASEAGAVRVHMVHLLRLTPEKLGRLYQRRGYMPTETLYVKTL